MKAKLLQDCSEGSKGEIVDLDQKTFEILTREGFAEKAPEGAVEDIGEAPDITDEVKEDAKKTRSSEGGGPIWSERVVIKRNKRNITVELWPPSDKHPEYGPSLRLVESRKEGDGWEQKSINLTRGPKTLFLSEAIRQGWQKLREMGD